MSQKEEEIAQSIRLVGSEGQSPVQMLVWRAGRSRVAVFLAVQIESKGDFVFIAFAMDFKGFARAARNEVHLCSAGFEGERTDFQNLYDIVHLHGFNVALLNTFFNFRGILFSNSLVAACSDPDFGGAVSHAVQCQ